MRALNMAIFLAGVLSAVPVWAEEAQPETMQAALAA